MPPPALTADACRPTILHSLVSWLPITENWIYTQINANRFVTSAVMCQNRVNPDLFIHDNLAVLYQGKSAAWWYAFLCSRLTGRYPLIPTQRALSRFRPAGVHCHFGFEAVFQLAAIKQSALPLITTFYGLDISKLPRRPLWRARYKQLFAYGSAFIVEGPFMASALAALGCPQNKISVIRMGIDCLGLDVRQKKTDTEVRVLFVGLSRDKKGPLNAATAFARAARSRPDLHLDIVGEGRYAQAVTRILQEQGVLHQTTFHGMIPMHQYRSLLCNSDIVLVPSRFAADGDSEGGVPVVAIEAQIAGIPVVGTTHCDIPDVVVHNETGLLCPERDESALAHNLGLLADTPFLRERLGAAGAERSRERHAIGHAVEQINAVYTSIIPGFSSCVR